MKARDIVFDYLRNLDVDYLFGVPGTNEVPIIDGTAEDGPLHNGTSMGTKHVNYIPCLHENIAMGAAAGYAHTTGKPGVVMLHVTPGIGHALGNLFNACKSHTPVLILCGQQHSQLILQEPLLASDVVRVAEQYTKWAYEVRTPEEFPLVLQRALKLTIAPPMGPVFLSIPWDYTIEDVPQYKPGSGKVTRIAPHFHGDRGEIARAVERLAQAQHPVILAGDGVGASQAWEELRTLAELIGAPVYTEGLSSMMNFPNNDYHYRGELPGFQEQMQNCIAYRDPQPDSTHLPARSDAVFLCGFNAQAQIVAYDYQKGPLLPSDIPEIYLHNDAWQIGKNHYGEIAILGDIKTTLPEITQNLHSQPGFNANEAQKRNAELKKQFEGQKNAFTAVINEIFQIPTRLKNVQGTIEGKEIATFLTELQQEQGLSILLDNEAISDAKWFQDLIRYDNPTSYFCAEGGSLGYSMPASIGLMLGRQARVGDTRLVVNVVGDGSALFYPQVWWTTARFKLPILFVITNNREYKTLQIGVKEITKLYNWQPSRDPSYLKLDAQPTISFVEIAKSFGIQDAQCVSQQDQLKAALQKGLQAIQQGRPYVLEVLTNPSLPTIANLQATLQNQFSHIQSSAMEVIL